MFPVESNTYVKTVNKYPYLTPERELELATHYRESEDLDAAQELVLSHLRVVVCVARGYSGYGLPQDDLIQEGTIGLMKAVKRFDPTRGVRLVSFALHYIRAEILNFVVDNWRLVKIAKTKANRKLFFNLRSLRKDVNTLRPKEVKEIAEDLNVSESEVLGMEARFAGHEIALDKNEEDGEEFSYQPINYIVADPEYEPSRYLERIELAKLNESQLIKALEELDPRARRIIEARWLCKKEDEATLHDLSLEFGVSKERIRQIETRALQKMQSNFAEAVTEYVVGE